MAVGSPYIKRGGCLLTRRTNCSPNSLLDLLLLVQHAEKRAFSMAANSRSFGMAAIGKRVVSQIWNRPPPSSLALRRAAHASAYDKNPEDQAAPSVVPNEAIEAPSDEYWAPHPKTGVFGPANDHQLRAHGELPNPGNAESSVLEHPPWFRPTSLEDLEKPPPENIEHEFNR